MDELPVDAAQRPRRAHYDKLKEANKLRQKHLVCVLENPCNMQNVGAIARSVCALGVGSLIVVGGPDHMPHSYEEFKRARTLHDTSTGANKWVFAQWFATTAECYAHLRRNRYVIATTSPHTQDKPSHDVYTAPFTHDRLALVFGNERAGVSREAIDGSDFCVSVPMSGVVESLNLSVTVGIVMSYAMAERHAYCQALIARRRAKRAEE
jgi:tRNA (guanosine-2'-O-)-methyltransferase